jgi:hypothetical protein
MHLSEGLLLVTCTGETMSYFHTLSFIGALCFYNITDNIFVATLFRVRPFGLLALKNVKHYLAFQSFIYELTRWRLFQKRALRTKIDIYAFIFDTLPHGSCLLRGLQSGSLIHIYRSLQVRFLQWRGTGPALSQFDQRLSIGPPFKGSRAAVIYSRLYTQHTAGFTENSIGPSTS